MKEIREILGDLDYEILSMKEAGVDVDIVEDGTTFDHQGQNCNGSNRQSCISR